MRVEYPYGRWRLCRRVRSDGGCPLLRPTQRGYAVSGRSQRRTWIEGSEIDTDDRRVLYCMPFSQCASAAATQK